ncbi:hypothetical protein KFE25_003129 [Diacronema lutheri]|uniref:PX domain-containing protein n=1 Tax=Diacronema lutheri TaxID=2081491 RepID=A0A8J5XF54_DIALT|nr:hypothetical protein KFE25_003129 [Diacronema lutheri]
MLAEEVLGPPLLSQQATAESLSIHVVQMSIGEPISEGFGPRKYTTYRITTDIRDHILHSTLSGGELALANGVSCRRRFSEFLKLRGELLDACPGVIVPPLPEKQTVGRFDPEFVEKRRRALSSFLCSCAVHPILATTPQVSSFCEWPPALVRAVLASAPRDYIPSAEEWERTEGGDPHKSALADIVAFEAQARKLREVLKRDHVRELERSVDLMELAQALCSFGSSEYNVALRHHLGRLSQAMGGLSTLSKLQAEADTRTLLALLKDYKNLAGAIAEQCQRRESAHKVVDATSTELRAAQALLAKAAGRAGASGERKAADLEARVAELRARADGAHAHLQLHTRTLSAELGRFHAQKAAHFRSVLAQMAAERAATSAQVHARWRDLVPALAPHADASPDARHARLAGAANGFEHSSLAAPFGGARGWGSPGAPNGTPLGAGSDGAHTDSFVHAMHSHAQQLLAGGASLSGALAHAYTADGDGVPLGTCTGGGGGVSPLNGHGGSRGLTGAQLAATQYSPPIV